MPASRKVGIPMSAAASTARATTRPAATTAAIASQPRARDVTLHRAQAAPEETLGPEVEDEQERDEDAGVLELERQHQQRQRLHEADDDAPYERARDAAEPAQHHGHEHQHDEVHGDVGLDRVIRRQ